MTPVTPHSMKSCVLSGIIVFLLFSLTKFVNILSVLSAAFALDFTDIS